MLCLCLDCTTVSVLCKPNYLYSVKALVKKNVNFCVEVIEWAFI